MNIATICYPTAGGSGVIATELSKSLARRSFGVHLISADRPIRADLEKDNLTYHQINIPEYDLFPAPSYGMATACTVGKVIRTADIDLIHAHYAYPHALSADLAREFSDRPDVPIVTTLHGTDIFLAEDMPCHHDIVKLSLARSNRITAVSSYLAGETKRILGQDYDIRVIPNFVDTDRFSPDIQTEGIREKKGLEEKGVLAHVSNFREIKNSEEPVRVLRYLQEMSVPSHLIMIGDGPEKERVKGLASEFHIREHITWLEPRTEIEKVIADVDLLLVTSDRESFGMSALEAMSCGVPVLNTSEGGIQDLVRDQEDGFHFDPADLYALSEKAAELIGDGELRKQIGRNARKRAMDNFSTEEVVDSYVSLYEEL